MTIRWYLQVSVTGRWQAWVSLSDCGGSSPYTLVWIGQTLLIIHHYCHLTAKLPCLIMSISTYSPWTISLFHSHTHSHPHTNTHHPSFLMPSLLIMIDDSAIFNFYFSKIVLREWEEAQREQTSHSYSSLWRGCIVLNWWSNKCLFYYHMFHTFYPSMQAGKIKQNSKMIWPENLPH